MFSRIKIIDASANASSSASPRRLPGVRQRKRPEVVSCRVVFLETSVNVKSLHLVSSLTVREHIIQTSSLWTRSPEERNTGDLEQEMLNDYELMPKGAEGKSK